MIIKVLAEIIVRCADGDQAERAADLIDRVTPERFEGFGEGVVVDCVVMDMNTASDSEIIAKGWARDE